MNTIKILIIVIITYIMFIPLGCGGEADNSNNTSTGKDVLHWDSGKWDENNWGE